MALDFLDRVPAYRDLVTQRRQDVAGRLDRALPSHGEFVFEVGCGHGHFLTAYASAHPTVCCIGVDLVAERVERAERKRDRAGLGNLHFIRSEARLFLTALPQRALIRRIFVLFPDPWPKARHHKHRILQPEFLTQLATRTSPECRLHFRTDYHPYFEASRALLAGHPDWELCAEPWPFEFETVFQSRAAEHHSVTAKRRAISLPVENHGTPN